MNPIRFIWPNAFLGYSGLVLILVVCGFGIPIPEDFILIVFGGYNAAVGPLDLTGVMLASFLGVLLGDSGIYFVGQVYGPWLAQHRVLKRLFPPDKIAHAEAFFAKHGVKAVFFARFVVGLRAAVFFTSGMLRVPFSKFLLADFLASVVSLPVWIWLGYAFHEEIETVMAWVQSAEHALTALVLLAAGFFLFRWYRRRRKRLAAEAAAREPAAGDEPPTVAAIEDPARGGSSEPDPETVEEPSA